MKAMLYFIFRMIREVGYNCFSRRPLAARSVPICEIVSVHFSGDEQEDVVTYRDIARRKEYQLTLKELVNNEVLLSKFLPLEASLLRLLCWENKVRYQSGDEKSARDNVDVEKYHLINRQFFSLRKRQEMLIMSAPNQHGQYCLSVREVLNQTTLMRMLRYANLSV